MKDDDVNRFSYLKKQILADPELNQPHDEMRLNPHHLMIPPGHRVRVLDGEIRPALPGLRGGFGRTWLSVIGAGGLGCWRIGMKDDTSYLLLVLTE